MTVTSAGAGNAAAAPLCGDAVGGAFHDGLAVREHMAVGFGDALAFGNVASGRARFHQPDALLAHLRAAAMARASIPPAERRAFHLIADEAHSFGPASIARLLSETRKFSLSIVLVTQFLDALTESTRAALLGNTATLAVFRSNPDDAAILARNFDRPHQPFNPYAVQVLEDGHAMISAPGIEPALVSVPAPQAIGSTEAVKRQSRRHYGRVRADVEEKIARALGLTGS